MQDDQRITFIGAGNMAGALIKGLLASATYRPGQILAADVRPERLEELRAGFGIETTTDNPNAVSAANIVVLSTKPQVLPAVLPEIAGSLRDDALVLSVAAGIATALIEKPLSEGTRVVRAMPNTPALVRAGATALASGAHATERDLEASKQIFESVGIAVIVDESALDAVTGLSGSGPAYVFLVIEALTRAGVEMGLTEQSARLLVTRTLLGSARLVVETGEDPAVLRERVTSPGGTTVAGLKALDEAKVRQAFIDAVRAATRRSRELGREAAAAAEKKG